MSDLGSVLLWLLIEFLHGFPIVGAYLLGRHLERRRWRTR